MEESRELKEEEEERFSTRVSIRCGFFVCVGWLCSSVCVCVCVFSRRDGVFASLNDVYVKGEY